MSTTIRHTDMPLERVLLVCGQQNAGKSRLLRHMLGDPRLGGKLHEKGPVKPRPLSRDRLLAVRITSPHESWETPEQFYEKITNVREKYGQEYRRINYASAIQPNASNNMPDIETVCEGLICAFHPERFRVVVLNPDQSGLDSSKLKLKQINKLRELDIEILTIDARRSDHPAEPGNLRILVDYFD